MVASNMENFGYTDSHVERLMLTRQLETANVPGNRHEALNIISLGSPDQSIEGMKVICNELTQATTEPDSSTIHDLVKEADKLVSCLAALVMDYGFTCLINNIFVFLFTFFDNKTFFRFPEVSISVFLELLQGLGLAALVSRSFNFSLSGASSRSCKYVLNTHMQTFQIKRLAHAVKESTLDNLITELLLWLLVERVQSMDDGSQHFESSQRFDA